MDQAPVLDMAAVAFAAGTVAALNPCGFVMLPAYLTLVVQGDAGAGRRARLTAVARALAATAMMTLGFLTVFGLFGLLTVPVATTVQRYLPYATVTIGIVLVGLGIWLLAGRELRLLRWNPSSRRWAPTSQLRSMFGYGVSYAIASLSCTIGPFLAITGSSFRRGRLLDSMLVYVAYAAGIGLLVGVLAIAAALANSTIVDRLRNALPYISRISGAILILVGTYVAYYGYYEIRLFAANGSPDDPVIAAAGKLQRSLAGWVYTHGALPWILALGILALVLAVARFRRPGKHTDADILRTTSTSRAGKEINGR